MARPCEMQENARNDLLSFCGVGGQVQVLSLSLRKAF